MWPFKLLFIPILNLLLEFEPNYIISSTKVPPKKNIYMHVQLPGRPKWKICGHSTKNLKKLSVLGVVCMLMTMWNIWAHEYLAILVGCQLFTAYWLSAIIWSRFVNETHEYLINSFIDHRRKTQNVMNDESVLELAKRPTDNQDWWPSYLLPIWEICYNREGLDECQVVS